MTDYKNCNYYAELLGLQRREIERLERNAVRWHKRCDAANDEIERLQSQIRDERRQVQAAIDRHGGLPDGVTATAHPVEQNVATVLAWRNAEIDRLRAELANAREAAMWLFRELPPQVNQMSAGHQALLSWPWLESEADQ